MSSQCNPTCKVCPQGFNSLNGRRCVPLNINVEYAPAPVCENPPTLKSESSTEVREVIGGVNYEQEQDRRRPKVFQ